MDKEDRSFDRIQSNAGNIGFAASMDTGMNGIHVNVQCEQFTYYNHFGGGTGWCNRNSKIGLSHPQMGEIMFATWLLPYNEGVAQWVDPFYDAGADSHTSIMGSVGANTIFYNTGDFDQQASASGPGTGFGGAEFNYAGGGYDTGFNRRQENIIQYWSPNWNGFVFRFAWTVGNRDETKAPAGSGDVDPVIRSSSLAYTNGPLWLAVTWQDHEDWTAVSVGEMESSDAESFRVAGRYIMDMGDGMSVQLSAMWENLEYEFNGVTNVDSAMSKFGYGNFGTSYTLKDGDDAIMAAMRPALVPSTMMADADLDTDAELVGVWKDALTARDGETALGDDDAPASLWYKTDEDGNLMVSLTDPSDADYTKVDRDLVESKAAVAEMEDDPLTGASDPVDAVAEVEGNEDSRRQYLAALQAAADLDATADNDEARWEAIIKKVNDAALTAAKKKEMDRYDDDKATKAKTFADANAALVKSLVDGEYLDAKYKDKDLADIDEDDLKAAELAMARATTAVGGNVKIERDAWMVSGKIKFGGPVDIRFSYMDADDLEVSCKYCSGDWDETAADAWNVGLFYTMPAGTELRLTYSEVDNDENGTYGQGISGTGLGTAGEEIEMFAVGIVHWFD